MPNEAVTLPENSVREFDPVQYQSFRLDIAGLKAAFANAPMEYAPVQQSLIVLIPQAGGSMEPFSVRESSVMMPGLQANHPEIRTYSGESMQSPGKKMRCSITPWGFKATIRRADFGIEYVEPIAKGQQVWYRVYDRLDFPIALRSKLPVTVEPGIDVSDDAPRFAPEFEIAERGLSAAVNVKIYRFACACKYEFSQDHGGTKPLVLAAIVEYTNTMNLIYEADLDVRLKLIDEEEDIIFLGDADDPYTGTTVGDWMSQNPLAMQQVLGSADKYDVGHVFARYLGGDAAGVAGGIGIGCTQFKGRGCSSGFPPYGDGFLSIPTQEIGHQWGGGHTWNHCDANNQFNEGSACEPGSGSTIMSYAGTCGADNVQNVSDLYYHPCSITEIRAFVETGAGNTCGTTEPTNNNTPVATHAYQDNFFIPVSTPFLLVGDATDPDGDTNLTYAWEEMDLGPSSAMGSPQANSPLFRSFPPSTSKHRYFPKLSSILTNTSQTNELLPNYDRDLTFRFIARDNRVGGGGIGTADVAFKSTTLAGPFVVTAPNSTGIEWKAGEYTTITWEVANTNKAPVNCTQVNLLLSTDGGQSYPITLAAGVPNNGIACVLVPNNITNAARLQVQSVGNVFFDISNYNFKIVAATQAGISLCADNLKRKVCTPETYTTEIETAALSSFTGQVALSISGLPAGATATFSPESVAAGASSTMTVIVPASVAEGNYDVALVGTGAGGVTASRSLQINVRNNDFTAMLLQSPLDGAIGVAQSPMLTWAAVPDADLYEVQVSNSPNFSTILASNSNLSVGAYNLGILLDKGKTYFWRVRGKNECGNGPWTTVNSFGTLQDACATFTAQDLPKSFSATGTPTVESKVTINSSSIVSDVNVKQIKGNHNSFWDLEAHLVGPTGVDVLLFKEKCGPSVANFNFKVDDAVTNATFPCPPPNNAGTGVKPAEQLSAFNGTDAAGAWILRIKDTKPGGSGSLTDFQLEICAASALNPPVIVVNNLLQLAGGGHETIGTTLLQTTDPNNSAAQLTYTLVTLPLTGELRKNGVAMAVGDQFTQADLDANAIVFYDSGVNPAGLVDGFKFVVTDGEGGMDHGIFQIQAFPVGTLEAANNIAFDLAPNPADETVRLSFGQAVTVDTRVALFNVAGQLVGKYRLAAGQSALTMRVDALPQGVYMVSVRSEQGNGVKKLVVR